MASLEDSWKYPYKTIVTTCGKISQGWDLGGGRESQTPQNCTIKFKKKFKKTYFQLLKLHISLS